MFLIATMLLLSLRLVERPLCGLRRPVTPWLALGVARASLRVIGLRVVIRGRPMRARGAIVSNHVGWMDILVLMAVQRMFFVAKAEVGGWPGIGWMARQAGTVFITRKGHAARHQKELFEARLRAGHRLMFFPEGTSTDGLRVLPFKSTLFEAFFTPGLKDFMHVQPVTLRYRPPAGADPRFYGWWGDMAFGPHMLKVLAARRQGQVEVIFHPPVGVRDFEGRKALARHCEATIRAEIPGGRDEDGA
ncbi:1-acyl-sn-glycerol-3-phosphate acyltransferase [Rhodobacteraceae bacterium WD3A24]|nr:1-acyl-sn-glycerol-3-phosphate acyltransferase [Rhodobacteraceae bacterium WD3A24]